MQRVGIRVATAADKSKIEEVYRLSVGTNFNLEDAEWNYWLNNGGLLVAELDGRIAGFGGIDVAAREQLKWLFLRPEFQRLGIGAQLLSGLEAVGWNRGLNAIRVHAAPLAETFYRKAGYFPVEPDAQLDHDHEGIELIKTRRRGAA